MCAELVVPGGYSTYSGTPLRPYVASAAVISASRYVQSARRSATRALPNACRTKSLLSATRSFTWHERHHAAVKSINTGRPSRRSASRRATEYRSQPGTTCSAAGAAERDAGQPEQQHRDRIDSHLPTEHPE